jgi:hypothetical protein
MIEVSSFLSGKNLCNIFADLIVRKLNELSPNAKTQISVINVRGFFIVRGYTTSEVVADLSEILSELYKNYDDKLMNTVRVIDTILYNRSSKEKLKINYSEDKNTNSIKCCFEKVCNELQNEGYYITVKIHNDKLYYDFEHKKDFDHSYISSKFLGYQCIKDDFSNDVYMSEDIYGLSNDGKKYYHVLLKKISYNLLNKGFTKNISVSISSDLELTEINSENINFNLIESKIVNKEKLESLILDVFNFDLSNLTNEFDLTDFKYQLLDNKVWESYEGTGDLMFL